MSLANAISTAIPVDGKPETPFYGLLQFCIDLDAERRRLDQLALQSLQAEEAE
jgi:hypothetical protein